MRHTLAPLVVVLATIGCDRGDAAAPSGDAPSKATELKSGEAKTAGTKSSGTTPAEAEAKIAEAKAAGPPSDTPKVTASSGPGAAAPEAGSGGPTAPPPPAEAPAALPKGPAAPSPWEASVQSTAELGAAGTLLVAADTSLDADPKQSVLWAQPVTDKEAPAGPAIKLRKTNGKIHALAAAFDGTTLWVAWQSGLNEDGRALQGLAGYDLALRQTVKTKNLRFFRYGGIEAADPLEVIARPGVGAGATVVAFAGTVRCKGMFFEEEGMTECSRLAVDLIGPDGTVELTDTADIEGGDPSFTVTEGDTGLDVDLLAWRGGGITENVYVSYGAKSARLSTCAFPPVLTAWVDGGLLSICRDPDKTGDEVELTCSPANTSACGTFYFARPPEATGTSTIPQDKEINFDRLTLGCKGNVPTVRVSYKGGHFDMPADEMGWKGKDAVLEGGTCKGKPLP